jgi:hypothetical protein
MLALPTMVPPPETTWNTTPALRLRRPRIGHACDERVRERASDDFGLTVRRSAPRWRSVG